MKNRTGYRGVYEHSWGGTYFAQITADGRREHLGSFPTAEAAAQAYDQAAARLHGEAAVLNFPPLLGDGGSHHDEDPEGGPAEGPDGEDRREPAGAESVAESDPWVGVDEEAHALVEHVGHHA